MSSRRVHGASGGGASTSESDNTSSSDESGSLPETVYQSTQGEDKKSGKESPVSSNGQQSSGRSLTTTSGSGSCQELGARPKEVERGRKSSRGRSNVWHNLNRRSAKNLKGYGQKIAATAEGNTGSTTSSTSEDRFVIVGRTQGIGPRRRRGPGNDCSCSTKGTSRRRSTDLSLKDSVVLLLLTMPVILVLLYDSSTTETGSTSQEVTQAVKSYKQSVGRSLAASIPLCAMIIIKLLIFMFSRYGKPRKQ
ncbi:hypothetical protein [Candidatus Ichthyocystis sparus]|uniref:hypothetical protein n=1 Tax=Candidatus Ichthyocystis sparus TaxID=1561004 RepID=UPI000A4AC720|nr:hypothetical protein [Candidatus Ichthyocystis sparus]